MRRVNVPQLKEFLAFSVKDRYQLNYFYLYQRLQCTGTYFFKIKFSFFVYLPLSAPWKENYLFWYISVIRQTVGYRTLVSTQPFSWCLHITITYNLPHLRLWYVVVVTVIAYTGSRLPNISDIKTRKRRNMIGIDMIRNNRIEGHLRKKIDNLYLSYKILNSQSIIYVDNLLCIYIYVYIYVFNLYMYTWYLYSSWQLTIVIIQENPRYDNRGAS